MLSVCAENGLGTWKVTLLLTDQRLWRTRTGRAGGAILPNTETERDSQEEELWADLQEGGSH